MLFVFLSHFAEAYLRKNQVLSVLYPVYKITMIASPTFMVISGIMLGYLYRTEIRNFARIRENFIARGLFLLTVGRVLIFAAHISIAGGVREALHWGFITDAIGFSIIVGPLLIDKLRWKGRLLVALSLFTVSWCSIHYWNPGLRILSFIKEMLFGPAGGYDAEVYADVFPLLPWFSLYFVGTCIGERMGEHIMNGKKSRATTLVLATGALCWLAVFVALGGRYVAITLGAPLGMEIRTFLSPFQKLPPGPVYLLFYGGAALLLLYVLFRFEHLPLMKKFIGYAEVIGQTSLFVFIVQYYVYFTFFSEANLRYTLFWPLYFIASVIVIYVISRWWFEHKLNRLLVVPYLTSLRRKLTLADHEGTGV